MTETKRITVKASMVVNAFDENFLYTGTSSKSFDDSTWAPLFLDMIGSPGRMSDHERSISTMKLEMKNNGGTEANTEGIQVVGLPIE